MSPSRRGLTDGEGRITKILCLQLPSVPLRRRLSQSAQSESDIIAAFMFLPKRNLIRVAGVVCQKNREARRGLSMLAIETRFFFDLKGSSAERCQIN